MDQTTGQSAASDIGLFRQAWADFTAATAATVAPEATYQAWLAHFAIQQFGLLRVVREIDFGTRYFGDQRSRFRGPNVMVDGNPAISERRDVGEHRLRTCIRGSQSPRGAWDVPLRNPWARSWEVQRFGAGDC